LSDILVEIKNAIIGADGFSPNAARAVDVAKGLIGKN